MLVSSAIATRVPLSLRRYSSASGPNSIDSGIAMAPSWCSAMFATAVSKRCGITTATRSPRATPSCTSALLRRLAACCRSA